MGNDNLLKDGVQCCLLKLRVLVTMWEGTFAHSMDNVHKLFANLPIFLHQYLAF